MQYDGEWPALGPLESGQLFSDSDLCRERHALGQVAPRLVAHVVDVAVAAIKITAAGDFQQNRVYVHSALALVSDCGD